MLNYQYEISDNKKINNLRQDANKYFNNTEKARNYVSMLEQIISDKDIDIRLDSNLKTADGKVANGSYSNGVITINPNSTKTGEFIAVHELTHAIGTDSMKSIIDTYRKSNIDFDNSVKSLLENYSTTELTDEALADVSAQLFGNQEFINNVSQNNPSVFKKIYNEIKYLWHQFRGYKNQDQFIDDLYYKWTQAYNSSNNLNNTTSYSTKTLEDGKKMTPREAYQSLVGTTIQFPDGDSAKIVNRLPGKDMYNELAKRYPSKYKDVQNIKEVNSSINNNMEELLSNTTIKEANVPDLKNRHQKQGIKNFDTRTVKFYDGNNAYDIDFSIAILEDGSKVAYAKKYIEGNQELTQKIKIVETRSEKSSLNQQPLSNNSITSQNDDVNTITKYSTQESENNTTKLQDRISGDKLLDIQDFINEIKSVGAEVDENGYVTVYHQTSTENANKIKESGMMSGKENGIFFSTSKEAQQSEGRGVEKLTFKIPAEILQLDDIFDNNADVRIPLKSKNETVDVSKYLINKENIKYSKNSQNWQTYLDTNFKSTGTKTNLEDIKGIAPIAEKSENTIKAPISPEKQIQMTQNNQNTPLRTSEQITNASGNDIEVVGKSIIDIFSEADKSNLSNEFDDYLLNKHNISRYAYEKGVFGKEISATDSQNIVNSYEKQHPEFIKWSKEVSQ